jgi:secondary thiamine-phosphate synthase enzyme
MLTQDTMQVTTRGRGTYDITRDVQARVRASGMRTGLCHLFVHHTSASLILCENADPTVRRDMEAFLARLVPDGDRVFAHTDEGPDDMPAHVRAILTQVELTVPISGGACALGTWQGLYLYEHRTAGHQRRLTLTLMGE